MLLPVLLIALAPILKLFAFTVFQSRVAAALQEVGRELSSYYYAVENLESEEDRSAVETLVGVGLAMLLSETVVRAMIFDKLPKEEAFYRMIVGGQWGMRLLLSHYDPRDERIYLSVQYAIGIPIFGDLIGNILISQGSAHRVWTGRPMPVDPPEELVYITESGKVYHTHLSCGSLSLNIKAVMSSGVSVLRNNDGEIYRACEICGNSAGSVVFISTYGNRYHSDRTCAGLKRTIQTIPISEVGDRKLCKRCEKRGGS